MTAASPNAPAAITTHLSPEVWSKVNRLLVRKAIAEYAHEQVFEPLRLQEGQDSGWHYYELSADHPNCHYRFRARRMALRHWRIDPDSIQRFLNGQAEERLDALVFITDFKQTLGIPADKLPIYLDEISSTLFGAAYKHTRHYLRSAELVDTDYQDFESSMTEGHPGFVANNGRLGFDAYDYHAYAPETGSRFALVWLAVHTDNAHFAAIPGLDHDLLLQEEVGQAQVSAWQADLRQQGLSPSDYLFMPTHPWQWYSKLSIMFAADIANRKIVPLGESRDQYVAQQSVRTYFNASAPHKCYVKTSLSVLNMGFMRGLSPYYMAGTPGINAYLHTLIQQDPVLRDYGFSILREVASIGYRNRYYEAALEADSPYKKMLSVLWRESPTPHINTESERLMTMAALLHIDPEGQALLPELIRRSGLEPIVWLERYLAAFLHPLVHCFYAHLLVFMPHGENLILVLEDYVPTRVFMKDIAEESAILDKNATMPAGLERLAVDVPEDYKILGIFIDVFDGVFRHMSHILEESGKLTENDFWRTVAASISQYQEAHPELNERFQRYNFFAPTFLHSCLNRLQLKNNLQMVDLANPASSLIMAEPLDNPVAPYAPLSQSPPSLATSDIPR
ncbi:IucA/IucC family protein [Alcaligenes parafaecalis]|uniref:IucA/IucC family siderophore biosynthesis protein n=1 Tax=Alcaligenes parafaecalis TaxID=171260 RepID=A0ABT3VH62_9BURK|nr:IucA/IucC family siderophore biosynthesis protein [Alcaligenes parafaecalis]MCX5462598.1 IucA/IucC family siderophore biosynthesis protein [Alcaligenes parafaecalis]